MILREVFDFLSTPWVGSVLGLIGLPLAIYIYVIGKRRSELSYQLREFSVVGGLSAKFPDELIIHFNNIKVDKITSTELVIWNSGNTTINGYDIVEIDPLRLKCNEGSILKIEILRSTRNVIFPNFTLKENEYRVGFDYLDHNDGFVAQIIHSGPKKNIKIIGSIKGMPKGINYLGINFNGKALQNFSKRSVANFPIYMMVIVGIFIILYAIFSEIRNLDPLSIYRKSNEADIIWPMFWMGVFYTALPTSALWMLRRRYPASLADPGDNEGLNLASSIVSKLSRIIS